MSALVLLPGEGKAVDMGGLGVVFKLFGADTGGRFALVEHPLAPGTLAGPPHVHRREDEASYVLEGEIMVQVGDHLRNWPNCSRTAARRISPVSCPWRGNMSWNWT